MSETVRLSNFASIANAVFNSVSANATAVTAMSVGGHTINATGFPGTANNATNLGGVAAASYQLNSALAANVATMTANNASNLGGIAAASYALLAGPTFTGNTTVANLAVTGLRITGDFSNATPANRLAFQSSTTNGATGLYVLPNGTSTVSGMLIFANSDPSNTSIGTFTISDTAVQLLSTRSGTGSLLPMTFTVGGSERMRIANNGNVGVGTSTPVSRLHVSGAQPTVRVQDSNASGANTFSGLAGVDSAGADQYFVGKTDSSNSLNVSLINYISGGSLGLWQIGAGSVYFGTNNTTRMFVDGSGNVGIGTTSPARKLEVVGDAISQFKASGDNPVLIGGVGTAENSYVRLYNSTASIDYGQTNGSAFVNVNNNQPWYMATGGAERLRVSANGNVGIGTSTPSGRLQVVGPANSTPFSVSGSISSLIWQEFVTAGVAFNYMWNNNGALFFGTNSNHSLIVATNSTERMRIAAGGNVGIGTSNPGERLTISGGNIGIERTASDYSVITITNTSGVQLHVNANGNSEGNIRTVTNHPLTFSTNNTERMRIDSTGRVTMPNQPMASGGPARGGDWFSGIVAPVSAHVNVGGHMNTSTGTFTAPVAGRYYVYVGLLHNSTWYIYVNINGADSYLVSHGNAYATTGGAVIVSLQANDTIRFNTSGNYYGSSHGSYAIYLLS